MKAWRAAALILLALGCPCACHRVFVGREGARGRGRWRPPARAAAAARGTPTDPGLPRSAPSAWAPTDPALATDLWTRSVLCWVQKCVIGLELCPWASASVNTGGTRVIVAEGDEEAVLACVGDELRLLSATDGLERATTLIASPNAFRSFEAFLEGAEEVNDMIEELALEGVLQLATFHPDYQFAETKADDASNWTNRSPLPIFHLLREREVAHALGVGMMDRDDVWRRNVERTRALGRVHMRKLVGGCSPRVLSR
ncbi:hypothetical protein T492DRAFT_949676 [Pavlovales sp. CCMP2436]|nr:hypothetical protein T492DRAFT_949676 [Pavlovales sp. CCMP2436]|mmetsp:Transcript_3117/g.7665  ORF Transcript_3117/g.7665 Transcript_3117/m.7665 type:complete len:257 (-) Transcript_3117:67-837(-)